MFCSQLPPSPAREDNSPSVTTHICLSFFCIDAHSCSPHLFPSGCVPSVSAEMIIRKLLFTRSGQTWTSSSTFSCFSFGMSRISLPPSLVSLIYFIRIELMATTVLPVVRMPSTSFAGMSSTLCHNSRTSPTHPDPPTASLQRATHGEVSRFL